jgi:hypothetical protein
VVGDRHAGGGLVGGLGEVGALHALLGVVEGVEVAGRQRGDGLGADHHPGVLDDVEHLRDAVVLVAEQGADGRALPAEGQLAGRGDLQAHLLLDVRDVDAVALAELTGLEVDGVLGQHEQGQALGAGAGALGSGQHEVHDVVDHVGLGAGDEALDAGDGPGAVAVVDRLGAAGADVGPGIRLGQHHRAVPALVGDQLGELLLLVVAQGVQQLGEAV